MKENECYSSTYVLGEFKANMVNDFLTLYGIVRTENNLADVCEAIAEVYNPRQKSRLLLLLTSLQRDYGEDYALIKEQLEEYPELLLHRFKRGIKTELLNETDCARAKAEIDTDSMTWKEKGIRCRQNWNQCAIAKFWKENSEAVHGLEAVKEIPDKMKEPLRCLSEKGKIPKGNDCKSLGDCIIALESLKLNDGCIVTSNEIDYAPICQKIGAQMKVIK
ncbi:MAG: hypothetical protein NC407_09145 [Lachnoclostridium sp.]|nr:hypothetical protein [Lachnoclostridium sp.]